MSIREDKLFRIKFDNHVVIPLGKYWYKYDLYHVLGHLVDISKYSREQITEYAQYRQDVANVESLLNIK